MRSLSSIKPVLITLCALSLSACVSLLPESTPSSVYRLSSPEPSAWTGEGRTIVRIVSPQAPRGLAGDEIAIQMADGHIAYMAAARWIAPAPRIMQNLIVDTFNAAGSRVAPVVPDDGVRAQYELRLDLREFEAVYDQGDGRAPLIRIRLAARLIASDGRQLAGSNVFSGEARASANRAGAIVAAFDQAAGQVSQNLAEWTADQTAD
ncbi:ABC-type transport auxiliary lipoprotein family protein [uncultured Maricaulis sp.]|uniref:ABC-type transport auxiliary lipoprotein family protein n=1 Tax=uncultured Maricaulis sp. TaxID=174710 RepID=UPI0030DBF250|tara:strand:- start:57342 stop:57962 length:621 start_codon:yes stop_codon:yes gene_type:complete